RPRPVNEGASPGVSTTWPTMLAPNAPTPPPMLSDLVFHWLANAGACDAGTRRALATVPAIETKPSLPSSFCANTVRSLTSTWLRVPGVIHAGSVSRPVLVETPTRVPARLNGAVAAARRLALRSRSEERRVGEGGAARWWGR